MPNQKNQNQVEVLKEKVAKAQSIAVIDYQGTTVTDQVELRSAIKAAGGEMFVTKNTLIDIATGKGRLTDSLKGMSAVVLSYDDPVGAIKALFAFHKTKDKLTIKQGLFEDKVISVEELENLSKLPNKNELLSMLLNRLQTPGTNLVQVVQAPVRNLLYALQAISQKQA